MRTLFHSNSRVSTPYAFALSSGPELQTVAFSRLSNMRSELKSGKYRSTTNSVMDGIAVNKYLHKTQHAQGLDATILSALSVVDADEGMVRLNLPLEKKHSNSVGTLHGGQRFLLERDGVGKRLASKLGVLFSAQLPGVSCTLVDIAGSLAISTLGPNYQKHVSIGWSEWCLTIGSLSPDNLTLFSPLPTQPRPLEDINTTFIKPAPIGSTITIISKADKVGKTLGFTTTTIMNGSDLICRGSHTKFLFFPKEKNEKS